MKTYNVTNRISAEAFRAISNCIQYHEKYQNSYFWSSGGNASQRRNNESRFAAGNPEFNLVDGNSTIEVRPSLRESCNNVYYSLDIKVNGKKKDIRAIKKYIARKMKKEYA